ncbi:MAG: DUF2231 domain-containing protein [Chloroflexota bacterium]|nr:DUF2231 domain-containing protein [Chloroflexota bacterium]
MPEVTVAGHPLHTILNDVPVTLMPLSLGMDLAHLASGKDSYADAAYYTMVGGCASAAAAGATGIADYLSLPDQSSAKRRGTIHLAFNMALAALYIVNLLLRARRKPRSGLLPAILSLVGVAGLLISVWHGGQLVYDEGMGTEEEAI